MPPKISAQKLDEMIEEATVDCYDEEEAAVGIFTMVEENLRLPFKTTILGQEASVIKIEQGSRGAIYAVCKHKTASQRIPLEDLTLPSPPPKGAERNGLMPISTGCANPRLDTLFLAIAGKG